MRAADAGRTARHWRGLLIWGALLWGLGMGLPGWAQADGPVQTAVPEIPLQDADERRYRELLSVLRCPVCQNESLRDSDAPLAADLRSQVRQQIAQGRSNAEVKAYLQARYGDFILYKPPLQANTWLLWGGPFGLVAVGALLLLGFIRRRRRAPAPRPVDTAALQRLLAEDATKDQA